MDSEDRSHEENTEYSGDNPEANTDSSENSEYTWESTYVYGDSSCEYSGSSYTYYSSDSVLYSDELSEPTSDDIDAAKMPSASTEVAAVSSDNDKTVDRSRSFNSETDVTQAPSCSRAPADDPEDFSGTSSVASEDQKVDEECKPKVTVRTQMPQSFCKAPEKHDEAPETSGYSKETVKDDEHIPDQQCKSNKAVTTQLPQSIGEITEEHDKLEASGYRRNNTIEDIDKLLLDHRTNIQNELEQLKLGNKPVTGQGHKEAVENFFSRSEDSEDVTPSEHRPKTISREVSALVDSRRVSSLLQSDRFMKRLESTLSMALGSEGKGRSRRMSWAGPYHQPASSNQSTKLRRRHSLHHSLISDSYKSDSRLSSHQPPGGKESSTNEPDERSPTPCSSNLSMIAEEDAMAHAKKQQMIGDINELVERELVKSSLEGKFRKNLERLMGNHLHHTNTDGKRVERFIKSLPPSRLERNDFSHLEETTSRRPQDKGGLSEEVAALKSQLGEMRAMLKASYDAQLDIQRAIRQEVAAAINNPYSRSSDEDGASSKAVGVLAPEALEPYRSGKCTICLELDVDSVLYKCGHMCVCYGCGMNLKAREAACPLCRAPIRDIIRIYR